MQAIQTLLDGDSKYLNEHPAMIQTRELMQKEVETRKKIKSLSQKTIDSSLNEDLSDNFKELNKTRKQLSQIIIKKNNLRTLGFQEFL